MRRAAVYALLACLATSILGAQEPALEETLKSLLDEALRINITARVIPEGADPIFNVERSKLTLPGQAVAVRFEGDNIRIKANLTPYLLKDGRLILVAQGEVWLAQASSADSAARYLGSIKSIPIELGEKIFFYPLGIPKPVQGNNRFNLLLEIQIERAQSRK